MLFNLMKIIIRSKQNKITFDQIQVQIALLKTTTIHFVGEQNYHILLRAIRGQ